MELEAEGYTHVIGLSFLQESLVFGPIVSFD